MLMKMAFWEISRSYSPPTEIATVQLPNRFPSPDGTSEEDEDTNGFFRVGRRRIHWMHDDPFDRAILATLVAFTDFRVSGPMQSHLLRKHTNFLSQVFIFHILRPHHVG